MKTMTFGTTLTVGLARLAWTTANVIARVAQIPDLLYDWQQRTRTRHQLMTMDDRLLKDMGISRYDAVREGAKPFWRE